jgi:hypothetical protein
MAFRGPGGVLPPGPDSCDLAVRAKDRQRDVLALSDRRVRSVHLEFRIRGGFASRDVGRNREALGVKHELTSVNEDLFAAAVAVQGVTFDFSADAPGPNATEVYIGWTVVVSAFLRAGSTVSPSSTRSVRPM